MKLKLPTKRNKKYLDFQMIKGKKLHMKNLGKWKEKNNRVTYYEINLFKV